MTAFDQKEDMATHQFFLITILQQTQTKYSIFQTTHLNKVDENHAYKDSALQRYINRYRSDATCYYHMNSFMHLAKKECAYKSWRRPPDQLVFHSTSQVLYSICAVVHLNYDCKKYVQLL